MKNLLQLIQFSIFFISLLIGKTSAQYCECKASNTTDEWITKFEIVGKLSKLSGSNGYSDFTNEIIDIDKGQNYPVSIEHSSSPSGPWEEYFRIYIDLNGDNNFDEPQEKVFENQPSPNGTPATGSITIPVDASSGQTRLRVIMQYGSFHGPCDNFTYGEVEDYTVNISGGDPTQYTVSTSIGTGTGTIHLNPPGGTYDNGITVTCMASPSDCFTGWTGNLSGSENPRTILINGNKSITGNFLDPCETSNKWITDDFGVYLDPTTAHVGIGMNSSPYHFLSVFGAVKIDYDFGTGLGLSFTGDNDVINRICAQKSHTSILSLQANDGIKLASENNYVFLSLGYQDGNTVLKTDEFSILSTSGAWPGLTISGDNGTITRIKAESGADAILSLQANNGIQLESHNSNVSLSLGRDDGKTILYTDELNITSPNNIWPGLVISGDNGMITRIKSESMSDSRLVLQASDIITLQSNHGPTISVGENVQDIVMNANKISVHAPLHAESIVTNEVTVRAGPLFPDYVFEKDYPLQPLHMIEEFIHHNKHLPNMPSAKNVSKKGINIGEMQVKLLEKIEEMTLHMIQMQKRIDSLELKLQK